jgi:DNA-binding transcriptional ArsR family regulator
LIINQDVDNLFGMTVATRLRLVSQSEEEREEAALSEVFAALADPVRRAILARLDGRELLVSEIAAQFEISLQAISKHIQVLVRAGLVKQERSGRISRCRLDAGPIFAAAVWLNRYSKYWQEQFNLMAAVLADIEERRPKPIRAKRRRRRAPKRQAKK